MTEGTAWVKGWNHAEHVRGGAEASEGGAETW